MSIYNEHTGCIVFICNFADNLTNQIAYLMLAFDCKKVPDELLPYVGLLSSVLGLMPEYSGDGVHVKAAYYPMWRDYLFQFGVVR